MVCWETCLDFNVIAKEELYVIMKRVSKKCAQEKEAMIPFHSMKVTMNWFVLFVSQDTYISFSGIEHDWL